MHNTPQFPTCRMVVDVLLTVAQILVFLYDVLSYPFYRAASRALGQVYLTRTSIVYLLPF